MGDRGRRTSKNLDKAAFLGVHNTLTESAREPLPQKPGGRQEPIPRADLSPTYTYPSSCHGIVFE